MDERLAEWLEHSVQDMIMERFDLYPWAAEIIAKNTVAALQLHLLSIDNAERAVDRARWIWSRWEKDTGCLRPDDAPQGRWKGDTCLS